MGNDEQTQPQAQPPERATSEHATPELPEQMMPSVYLLLWQLVSRGLPTEGELNALGLSSDGLRELTEAYPDEYREIKRMARITNLMDLRTLGALLRSILMEQLARAKSASDIMLLTKAAKQLPAWALPMGGITCAPVGMSGGIASAAVASPDATDNGGSLIDGALEAELNRIRNERGQQPLNRQQRRARDARKRGK